MGRKARGAPEKTGQFKGEVETFLTDSRREVS
jgi:hypothetical protein